MIIAADARTMGSRPSGVGMYLFDYLKELHKDQDIKLILFSDVAESEEMKYFQEQGVEVYCFGKKVYRSGSVFTYLRFIRRILLQCNADIFWQPNNLLPVRMKGFQGKVVLTIHDLFPITMPQYFGKVYQIYFRYGMKRSAKNADAFLFDSEESRKDVLLYYPSTAQKPMYISHVIIHGKTGSYPEDKNYFLYVGNMEKRKGTDLLLDAFRIYRKQGGKRELFLVGKMREDDIQEKLESVQDETGAICYEGYVSNERKHILYSEMSCFVFPSRAEGFGMPPIEAMFYEKPILISDLPIFHEILGEDLNYVSQTGLKDEQILKLAEMLGKFDNNQLKLHNKDQYIEVLRRYRGEVLGNHLKAFLYEVGK